MTTNEGIPELRYGDRLFSPTIGEGVVVGTNAGLVRVCFDRDKIERDCTRTDLRLLSSPGPFQESSSSRSEINPAVWNVVVIAIGILIALIGLFFGLTADPENSAFRQTVKALWIIQGLIGLLIAAVGIHGATVTNILHRDRRRS